MKAFFLVLKIWLTILPVAFLNGTVRVFLINPFAGEELGHIISTLTLSIAVVLIVYFFLKKSKTYFTEKDLLMIGLSLVIMTMIFEFGLGRVTGKSWEFLLADYDIFKGRIWPLVLITEFFSPYIIKNPGKK